MLIKYKDGFYTLREVCAMMKLNYDDFMAWCHKFALQNYQTALNYYKRALYQKRKAK
jgi:hypothetical protein